MLSLHQNPWSKLSLRLAAHEFPFPVYLQFSIGEIEKAAVVSLLMIALAFVVLLLVRNLGKSDAMPNR